MTGSSIFSSYRGKKNKKELELAVKVIADSVKSKVG